MFAVHNKAVSLEERILSYESGIQIQEQRQRDLIPQLVKTVLSYTDHESSTLEEVTKLRSFGTTQSVDQTLAQINVIVEAYPELKANKLYSDLMTEMTISENIKKQYRELYTSGVREYRAYVRKIPNRWVLSLLGYEPIESSYLEFESVPLDTGL